MVKDQFKMRAKRGVILLKQDLRKQGLILSGPAA